MANFPRLFHKTSKGVINVWDIWTEGDTIYTRWGKKDGTLQEASKKAKAKNVGKKNATTAAEQADLEAQAMWTKKLERKYYASEKEAMSKLVFLPMLADSYKTRERFLTKNFFPAYIQPKLDGLRCLAYWSAGAVKLLSRGGKEYILPHVSSALASVLPDGDVLDGELYIHGEELQQLNRLIRGAHKRPEEALAVEYHVYDIVIQGNPDMPCSDRMKALASFHQKHDNTVIREVQTHSITNHTEILKAERAFVKAGYEGAIVRLAQGTYKFGYRSKQLLKVKSFQDAEFEIVDFTNGIGKFEHCIIYTCVTDEGNEFNVVPKGTYEQRKQWLKEGQTHVGKQLKVKFFQWTEDKKPQFPVGICVRLEEDME